ncbi:MAG: ABC transporter substrate-binding protein [Sphaerobacter sp.]|nr:ABC transporter substrate-binding protein [Sphaerobacter sp.]
MAHRISQERAETIIRQFHRLEAYFAERGIGRRQFLRLIAAGSAASTVLPVLVACGAASDKDVADATAPAGGGTATSRPGSPTTGGTQPGTLGTGGAPKSGGTIIIGTLGEAQTINPLLVNETEGTWRCRMLFGEFVELDPASLKPSPGIAKEWIVSDDGREVTFTLQDNVTFSDGTPLTAKDIEFTLYAILKKETASPHAARFLPIAGASAYYEGKADTISGIQVIDDKTIKLTTAEPYAALLVNLRHLRPLPKHLLDGKNLREDAFFQNPVGAGPFMFKSWSTGQDFVAVRNPHYWEEGKPYLDGFTHRTIPDAQTLVIALQTGQIHGTDYAQPTQAEDLQKEEHLTVLTVPPGKDINGWSFSQKNVEALRDVRVRRAIAMAIDTERFASDFLLGLGRPANGPIAPGNWAYNENLKPIPYDPAEAKRLVEEAGVSGLTLKFTTNAGNHLREDWLTFTQQSLAELGITVQPDLKEWSQVVQSATEGTFEVICPTWAGATYDPDELFDALGTDKPRNVFGYSNPEFDEVMQKGRTTLDLDERAKIYARAQEILLADVPVFYAWDRPFIYVVSKDYEGYTNNIITLFQDLQDWTYVG